MYPANKKILVAVEYSQKESVDIGGQKLLLAKDFSTNRRESHPVVAQVVDGNGHLPDGTFLIVHHNRFVETSPHHLEDNLYSLAFNESIFAFLDNHGNAQSLCDNIIVEHLYSDENNLLPDYLKKADKFKYRVLSEGGGFEKGDEIFCYEKSDYEIVYIFKGVEHRVVKVAKRDVVGKIIR